jgi:hypothetical protein
MSLLHAGVDTTVIALWLGLAGVRSTNAYLHADLAIKERVLARLTSTSPRPARYRPPDRLHAFLEGLCICRRRPEGAIAQSRTCSTQLVNAEQPHRRIPDVGDIGLLPVSTDAAEGLYRVVTPRTRNER